MCHAFDTLVILVNCLAVLQSLLLLWNAYFHTLVLAFFRMSLVEAMETMSHGNQQTVGPHHCNSGLGLCLIHSRQQMLMKCCSWRAGVTDVQCLHSGCTFASPLAASSP